MLAGRAAPVAVTVDLPITSCVLHGEGVPALPSQPQTRAGGGQTTRPRHFRHDCLSENNKYSIAMTGELASGIDLFVCPERRLGNIRVGCTETFGSLYYIT